MSRHAYVTKRLAPVGYVAVTKPLAQEFYEQGHAITLCGNNVNCFHVFQGWHLGYTITKEEMDTQNYCPHPTFAAIAGSFLSYLEPELGTSVVYYVKTSALQGAKPAPGITAVRCRTCGAGGHQVAGQCVLCATRPSTAGN